jgi:hypothetical protein
MRPGQQTIATNRPSNHLGFGEAVQVDRQCGTILEKVSRGRVALQTVKQRRDTPLAMGDSALDAPQSTVEQRREEVSCEFPPLFLAFLPLYLNVAGVTAPRPDLELRLARCDLGSRRLQQTGRLINWVLMILNVCFLPCRQT